MSKLFKGILITLVIAVLAVAVIIAVTANESKAGLYITQKDGSVVLAADLDEYAITTEDGTTGVFAYTSKDKDMATLDIDGNFYQLTRVESASGARYANEDESVVYWEHQGEATIEIDGELAHAITDIVAVDILVPATATDEIAETEIETEQQDELSSETVDVPMSQDPLLANDWAWQETVYNDGEVVTPTDSAQFIARFNEDGTFSSTTDCNNTFGAYTRDESALTFGPLAATLMACLDETKEMIYGEMLSQVTSYMIADNGNLVLMLKYDTGSMIFTPHVSIATDTKAADYNSSRSNRTTNN